MNQINVNISTNKDTAEITASVLAFLNDMGCRVSVFDPQEYDDHNLTFISARMSDLIPAVSDAQEVEVDATELILPDLGVAGQIVQPGLETYNSTNDSEDTVKPYDVEEYDTEAPIILPMSTPPVTILTLTMNDSIDGFIDSSKDISYLNVSNIEVCGKEHIKFVFKNIQYQYPLAFTTAGAENVGSQLSDKTILVVLRLGEEEINHGCLLEVCESTGPYEHVIFGKDLAHLFAATDIFQ